ncbi:MAG: hypothetical protein M0D57_06530 [Sphingobacteriales bacterium JAD_PAG50586_3]|nr:MAG: hypothetical protein M0D57_06530 [Sphingobacteriales bacterium JAD_PAG50586_3]
MNKSVKAIAALLFASGTLLVACNNSPENKQDKVDKAWEKSEDAKENLNDAKEDLAEAKQDSIDDYSKTRAMWVGKFAENEDRIKEYRKTIDNMNSKEAKAKARRDADELERKNKEMKAKMEKAQKDGNWDKFKREFNSDMDNLGKAISDLFKDNKK